MGRCVTSLAIQGKQVKIQGDTTLSLLEHSNQKTENNIAQDVEILEPHALLVGI